MPPTSQSLCHARHRLQSPTCRKQALEGCQDSKLHGRAIALNMGIALRGTGCGFRDGSKGRTLNVLGYGNGKFADSMTFPANFTAQMF